MVLGVGFGAGCGGKSGLRVDIGGIGGRKINESVCGGEGGGQLLLLKIEILRDLLILLGPAVGLATGFRLQLEPALLAAPPLGQLTHLVLVDLLELAALERTGALAELCVGDGAQGGGVERPAGEVSLDETTGGAVLELLEFRQRVRLFTPPLQLYKDILGTHPSLLNYIENQRFNVANYHPQPEPFLDTPSPHSHALPSV